MRAISLWQPWASLWVRGVKIHETRHWPTFHRGWLVVHAAKKLVSECGEELDAICLDTFGPHWRTELPRGAIIGAVQVVGCTGTVNVVLSAMDAPDGQRDLACGNFEPGRYAWRADQFKTLAKPVPYRGMQSMFNVPDEVMGDAVNIDHPNLVEPPLPNTAAQVELFK